MEERWKIRMQTHSNAEDPNLKLLHVSEVLQRVQGFSRAEPCFRSLPLPPPQRPRVPTPLIWLHGTEPGAGCAGPGKASYDACRREENIDAWVHCKQKASGLIGRQTCIFSSTLQYCRSSAHFRGQAGP